MTDSNNNKPQQKVMEIDLMALFRKLYESRKKIYKTIGVGIAIGLIVSFSLPKIYEVKVSLSPESGINGTNGLSGIASMFGLGNASTGFGEDALTFNMFPEIVKTNPFALEMLQIPIQTQKGDSIILYDYLNTEKKPWWSYVMGVPGMLIGGIKSLFTEEQKDSIKAIDPFRLTPEQSGRIGMLKKVLEVETDKKTNMTKVTVSLQDPLAAAIVADSAVHKLQEYITDYRTRKAKQDYDFQFNLCEQYKKEYFEAQQEYAKFADANRNVILQTVTSEKERLQKNLTLAEQIYSQSMGQLQVLRGKLQEAKPVFAVVEPATVPLTPASPKKMLIIIAFAFLAFALESAWILFGKEIYHDFKNELKKQD
ncbi:chain-length determining protein [Phocaeicola plebeius]|uniref:Chain-length determining protein n=1 Tax=Phocaeicola plebeius TaxID=310297 RepID=A0A3E4Z9M5_9BACT|nr:Wzz/FepE/Etk N-terminal domain-containing protein [Phocaeicola plebeius]RGM91768.1 chain-length determining protein [Phocaeicola plebeius]